MLPELPKAIEHVNVGAGVQTQEIWLQGQRPLTLSEARSWNNTHCVRQTVGRTWRQARSAYILNHDAILLQSSKKIIIFTVIIIMDILGSLLFN